MQDEAIRLDQVAHALGVHDTTAWRWLESGVTRGTNRGRGRGRGVVLTREQAFEVCAVALLRGVGVPMPLVRRAVREVRARGCAGKDFLAIAETLIQRPDVSGAIRRAPLRDITTGQSLLLRAIDPVKLLDEVESLVDAAERDSRNPATACGAAAS